MTDQNSLAITDPAEPTGIVALDTSTTELTEIFGGNLAGMDIQPSDLTRIKIPGSGGTHWQFETADGPQSVPTLTGVIVHKANTRGWWAVDLDDAGEAPPACRSNDGITAQFDQAQIPAGYDGPLPTEVCATCPLAQFSEAAGETPCQKRLQLYMLHENEFLPVIVDLPRSSIKPMRQFLLRLSSARMPIGAVIVQLGLEQTKSRGGVKYSVVVPRKIGELAPDVAQRAQDLAGTLLPGLAEQHAA